MSATSTARGGPLQGIKIVDLTSVIMGPYATQIMADFGADVIKIESPQGDIIRFVGKNGDHGMGPMHLNLNRGKHLVSLDLKKPEALDVLKNLVQGADAFVHAMRPQAIERLGLDYASVRSINKDIVYCGAYGFGAGGPYSDNPAYDDLIQGLSGITDLGSQLAGEPRFFPTLIADKVAGLALAYSLLAALLHRQRSGEGQQVEVPMFETMVQFLMIEHLGDYTFGQNEEIGYSRVMSQLRKPHRTSDGYICALPYNDKHRRDFFMVVKRPDLAGDARFSTHNARSENYGELYGLLASLLSEKSTAYWLEELRAADIPVSRAAKLRDVFDDPHLREMGLFQTVQHPDKGPITAIRSPIVFSASPATLGKPAGAVGADTTTVLQGLGYSEAEIGRLLKEEAVVQG